MRQQSLSSAIALLIVLSFSLTFSQAQSPTPPPPPAWGWLDQQLHRLAKSASVSSQTAAAEAAENYAAAPNATWVQSSGPETGNAFALLRRGQRLFMGTFGGLWFSDDNGENWARTTNNGLLIGRGVSALAANSTTLFLGTNFGGTGGGVYRSNDNGQTWTAINNGFPAPRSIQDFLVNGANLFAVTFNGELFGSTNNGDSWTRLTNGLPSAISVTLAGGLAFSNNALLLRNAAAATPELYRSTDNGLNWTKVEAQALLGGIPFALATSNNKVFLGSTVGLLSSENGGQTWQIASGLPPVGSNFTYAPFASGATVYTALFASAAPDAESTLYVSTDNGATWTQKMRLPFSQIIYDLLAEGPTVFLGTPGGVLRLNDNGASLEFKNKGLRSSYSSSDVAVLGNRVFVSSLGGGLWVTADSGATWRQLKNGLPYFAFVSAVSAVGNTLYTATNQPFGLYRSTDFGETWTPAGKGLPPADFNSFPTVLAANGGKLYLGFDSKGLWLSADNGENFAPVTSGLPGTAYIWSLAFRDNAVFVATNGAGAFRSMDGGNSFTAINTGLTTQTTRSLQVAGDMLFLTSGNGVYRSADSGGLWTRVLTNAAYDSIARSGGTLYVAGTGAGCYSSKDNGATWQANNDGLFGLVSRIAVSGNSVVLASQGSGVFFQPDDTSAFATVSAASFSPSAIADKTIVAAFGTALATSTAAATALPLPLTLAGTSVKVRDTNGTERPAPLFFVSAGQINYQIPAGTANGTTTVTITNGAGVSVSGVLEVRATAPAIFTTNATGAGAAAALDALRFTLGPFDAKQANGEPNIIAVFGTGLGSDATDVSGNVNASVTTRLNGVIVPTLYAGTTPGLAGLNQFNLQLPANITTGTYTLTITRGGVTSNSGTLAIK
ncbi:MAG: hypothetical protein HYR56_24350 [Acidobacteria bacterium]|nr:hypothetical protein [Acidobacteriota bacterium]MBI3423417.1 hypothetical protein [Acidobacteriota bacterium]